MRNIHSKLNIIQYNQSSINFDFLLRNSPHPFPPQKGCGSTGTYESRMLRGVEIADRENSCFFKNNIPLFSLTL